MRRVHTIDSVEDSTLISMDDDSIIVRFVEVPGWAITSDWMKDKFDLVLPDGEIYPDVTCTVADNDQEVIFNI